MGGSSMMSLITVDRHIQKNKSSPKQLISPAHSHLLTTCTSLSLHLVVNVSLLTKGS